MTTDLEVVEGEVVPDDTELVFPSDVIHSSDPKGIDLDYCLHHVSEIRYRLTRLAVKYPSSHHEQAFVNALGHLDMAEAHARLIVEE